MRKRRSHIYFFLKTNEKFAIVYMYGNSDRSQPSKKNL
ncbi:hypothetical protein LEP1GSC059_4414 [Leptospira noguchii serovar Panama str. CZ214]|uniref:Uncharacterized protein n=1 Tax=Leptospira noguchii serovar Panama str. CZ214 TaxID=1001595 RepID=T0GTF9_9LEPT|nr:hypothetical protein LEP1GSC059_4414 [Leptospira noguchii serovar Panama str. CZ214]